MRVFVTTIGEEITFDCLANILAHTPQPFDLTVWYDACGRGVDAYFLGRLQKFTDDVIVIHKNKGLSAAWGFATLYLDFDYIIIATADLIVLPGYFEKMLAAFKEVPDAGIVGDGWRPIPDKSISDFDIGIDGICMASKRAINAAGGVSPSFNGRGPFHTEWHRRMANNGLSFVTLDDLCLHGGKQHEGRDLIQDWQKELHEDNLVYLHADKLKYQDYPWWSNNIRKEETWREIKSLPQMA